MIKNRCVKPAAINFAALHTDKVAGARPCASVRYNSSDHSTKSTHPLPSMSKTRNASLSSASQSYCVRRVIINRNSSKSIVPLPGIATHQRTSPVNPGLALDFSRRIRIAVTVHIMLGEDSLTIYSPVQPSTGKAN